MQAAEKAQYITLSPGQRARLWPRISLCSMLWSFWISPHWKLIGAERAGILGGHARWMGTVDFSTFFDICITAARVGLPSLSLPLHFMHEATHLERNRALSNNIMARKKETDSTTLLQPTTTSLWPWSWEKIPELSRIVPYHRRHCLLCHWLWKNRHGYHRKLDSGAGTGLSAVCT